jgi:hypothetical protein
MARTEPAIGTRPSTGRLEAIELATVLWSMNTIVAKPKPSVGATTRAAATTEKIVQGSPFQERDVVCTVQWPGLWAQAVDAVPCVESVLQTRM